MLGPGLDFPVAVIIKRRILDMQIETLEPSLQQFQQSLIGGCCHVCSSSAHPKRTHARWLAVHRDSAALDCRPCVVSPELLAREPARKSPRPWRCGCGIAVRMTKECGVN